MSDTTLQVMPYLASSVANPGGISVVAEVYPNGFQKHVAWFLKREDAEVYVSAHVMRQALTIIHEWPFAIAGDCVADARQVAQAALCPIALNTGLLSCSITKKKACEALARGKALALAAPQDIEGQVGE